MSTGGPAPPRRLGDFEILVVVAIEQLGDSAYAAGVCERIEALSGQPVASGALYRALDRLRAKRMVDWERRPSGSPPGGGHPRRRLRVTQSGLLAARGARKALRARLTLLDELLG